MPKNVMKLLKRQANYARHDFDLSHRHLITANFGELLPATFIETVPDDYIELRAADLIRAIPMVTSPFMRAKQHIDVWYVPYDYLWSNFSSFITQKSQPTSSSLQGQSFIPHEDLDYIQGAIRGGTTLKDVVGRDYIPGAKKLYDLCGYGQFEDTPPAQYQQATSVNLWRIAAYNKIWYDEYRQQYYDSGVRIMDSSVSPNAPLAAFSWNFDDLPCTSSSNSRLANTPAGQASDRVREMFQMRYRCWKKDLFTGIMPAQQYGNVSSITTSLPNNIQIRPNNSNSYDGVTIDSSNNNLVATNNGVLMNSLWNLSDYSTTVNSSFDVLELRKAQAMQIWRERSLTAGNRISDNLKAHFGNEARYDDHRATHLGSVDAPLNIQDIDATAQIGSGTNQGLADVAGKGTSALQNKVFKFKAHEFGVIVVLFSILPEAEYESLGIDRLNALLEWEDYFNPVMQDLGLEAVDSKNFYVDLYSSTNASVIGYAPRFYGYKQKLDKCFSGFHDQQAFASWASPKTDVATNIASSPVAVSLSNLYVNPALYDRNFAVGVSNSEQTICDLYFDVSAVRQMSPSGLPNY